MPENMPAPVLGHEVAEIASETHVCGGALAAVPLRDGEALEENETAAVEQFLPCGFEEGGECWGEGEALLVEI